MKVFQGRCLVIGISHYDRITTLPPVEDAQDMAAVLRNAEFCGYSSDSVEVLMDAAATRQSILAAVDRLVDSATDRSSVFIYFSGHGGRVASGPSTECYLMPVDGTWRSPEDLGRTAISGRELSERVARMQAARVTIALDCCRAAGVADAGAAPAFKLDSELVADAVAPLAQGRGRAVLAASRRDGLAYAEPTSTNSAFTRHLLDGLRGAANGTGGVIRVCDLFHYVQQEMRGTTPGQCPVFKAELEENYPVALHHGGKPAGFELPPAPDACKYDAFISYRRVAPDRAWVERVLVPRLEGLGLRLCLAHRDFKLGAPRIREMEQAVESSRYTVAVFSPRYLDGSFEEYQALLSRHQGLETKTVRFIPLMRESCQPALGVRAAAWLDVGDEDFEDATVLRLGLRLREPYQGALDGQP